MNNKPVPAYQRDYWYEIDYCYVPANNRNEVDFPIAVYPSSKQYTLCKSLDTIPEPRTHN